MDISFYTLEEQYATAKAFAERIHASDLYGEHPYSYHLNKVERNVIRLYKKNDFFMELRIVAQLHDTIEDHPSEVTEKTLLSMGFNQSIVDAVVAISHNVQEEPLKAYWERCGKNEIARRVKICDALANISEPDTRIERVRKYSNALAFLLAI